MELQFLTEFLALAETLSFTRAAARLHMSATSLTRHIQRLERDLDVLLFDRTPPLRLTPAGIALVPKATKVVRDMERMKSEMAQAGTPRRSVLKVGFFPGLLHLSLTGALAKFGQDHADVSIQLRELSLQDQVSGLLKEELDVAVVGHSWPELTQNLDVFDLGKVPLCAVLAASHPLACGKFDLRNLREEEFIGLCGEAWPGHMRWTLDACRESNFEPKITTTAPGPNALLIMVGASRRIGLLPATANKIPHAGVDFHSLPFLVPCCAAVRPAERRPIVRKFLLELQREFLRVAHSFGFPARICSPTASHGQQKALPTAPSVHVA